MMVPQTTKQMMKQSFAFRFSFAAAIALVAAVIILSIVLPTTRCSYSSYQSCQDQYGYNYLITCYTSSSSYCCLNNYSYCGDYYNCLYNYSDDYWRGPCLGVLIAMWACSGLCFIFTVLTLVMFCNFRSRVRLQAQYNQVRANYAAMAYPNNSANQIVIS